MGEESETSSEKEIRQEQSQIENEGKNEKKMLQHHTTPDPAADGDIMSLHLQHMRFPRS